MLLVGCSCMPVPRACRLARSFLAACIQPWSPKICAQSTVTELKQKACEEFGVTADQVTIFDYFKRQKNTVVALETGMTKTLDEARVINHQEILLEDKAKVCVCVCARTRAHVWCVRATLCDACVCSHKCALMHIGCCLCVCMCDV